MGKFAEKISIITVCFNSGKTIRRTIESVLQQSFNDWKYIIVDGASSDDTLDIINSYRASFKSGQLHIISEPDRGIYDAMNKGIALAHGELVGIINSDDWYEQGCLEKVWEEYLKSKDKDVIIYGEIREFSGNIEERTVIYSHNFLKDRMIAHPACFISKSIYDRIGVYDRRYSLGADYDLMLRALESNVNFVSVKQVLANFTQGGASSAKKVIKDVIDIKYHHKIYSRTEYIVRSFLYYGNLLFFKIKSFFKQ